MMAAAGRTTLQEPPAFEAFERRFSAVAFKPELAFEGAEKLGSNQVLMGCSIRRWRAILAARYLVVADGGGRILAFGDAGLDEAAALRQPLQVSPATFDALSFAGHCKEQLSARVEGFHSVFPRLVLPAERPGQWVGLIAVVTRPDSGMHQYRCASEYPGDSIKIERLANAW